MDDGDLGVLDLAGLVILEQFCLVLVFRFQLVTSDLQICRVGRVGRADWYVKSQLCLKMCVGV